MKPVRAAVQHREYRCMSLFLPISVVIHCRSRRGNLTRRWMDKILTVFKSNGSYSYCIADQDGPRFCEVAFETEQEAVADLIYQLRIRERNLWA